MDSAIGAASEAPAPSALSQIFAPAFAEAGFQTFGNATVRRQGGRIVSNFRHGIFDLGLIAHAREHGLVDRDPAYRLAAETGEPIFWSDLRLDELEASEREMIRQCEDWGVQQLFVLARSHPSGSRTAVVAGSADRSLPDPLTRQCLGRLAECYDACLERLLPADPPGASSLSERQIECLRWARVGKSASEIAEIIGISPRTVEEHFSLACHRLSVRGRVSAVAKAITLGLL